MNSPVAAPAVEREPTELPLGLRLRKLHPRRFAAGDEPRLVSGIAARSLGPCEAEASLGRLSGQAPVTPLRKGTRFAIAADGTGGLHEVIRKRVLVVRVPGTE
jgi:hypothetical protein